MSTVASFMPPVLAQSRSWLVLDKPAGLAVHQGPRTPHSLEQLLRALAPRRPPPQPVHRLDRDTSGCLLVATRPSALRQLSAAFASRSVEKIYWAIVAGPPRADSGRIEAALGKISSRAQGWRMVADPNGKPAATDWEVIARVGELALIAFRPETGRTHQIRVHATLLAPGAVIVGDPVYGAAGQHGMMLHAQSLSFPNPDDTTDTSDDTLRIVCVTAPLPARFRTLGFDDRPGKTPTAAKVARSAVADRPH